jgi:hypothetical protein
MGVQIPPVLVLIVCKTISAGAPDQNSVFTHWENLKWDIPNSMMVCRRNEVQLYDPAEGMNINPNFTITEQCARAGVTLATEWDQAHRNTPWRVWRIGCPAPIVDVRTGALIGYKLPECGHQDTVVCETDSVI